jgi:two-component system, response regulator
MRQRHILEDADEDFETVQDAARQGGMSHPIVRAHSGGECLLLLQAWRDGPRSRDALPLLLLMDLNTPGDDGRAVLQAVRGDEALRTLPVVVLSASANPRDLQFCYASGANAFHVKPVNHVSHLRVLQEIFAYWLGSVVLPS